MNNILEDLKKLNINNLIENEPLYKHTTFKVGGPAMIFVDAIDLSDVTKTIDYCLTNNIKYFILGNGSNVLISDKLFDGIIISTKKLNSYEINNNMVYAMCGVNLISLAYISAEEGLSGLEFASGIPGCVGGSIYMNAGAYKKEMANVVKEVLVYKDGKLEWIPKEDLSFTYRNSIFQKHREWVILAVNLELEYANKDVIIELIEHRKSKRLATQPIGAYCAGSTFKNPSNEIFSWQLIDEANLRGYKINDAQVSMKHSNFIINRDRASASDIYNLICLVKKRVLEKSNIELHEEVELVNFD
ncbi:MAG: UDP-N-acetylmuramate dehydrogenase [Bacilli bacterium]|jgi:UDP-N-acetylmuramate dehydrogenase|nr:UDP-N-acetylmuramate dehydrogenase [Bacilli bacterium]